MKGHVWQYLVLMLYRQKPKLFLYFFSLSLAAALAAIVYTWIIATLLLQVQQAIAADPWILLLSVSLFLLGSVLLSYLQDHQANYLSVCAQQYFFPLIWRQLLHLPLVAGDHSGEKLQQLKACQTSIAAAFNLLFTLSFSVITLIGFLVYLFYCQFNLSVWLLVLCSGIYCGKWYLFTKQAQMRCWQQKAVGSLAAMLQEALLQIAKIRTSAAEDVIHEKFRQQHFAIKNIQRDTLQFELSNDALDALIPLITFVFLCVFLYSMPEKFNNEQCLPFLICLGQWLKILEKSAKNLNALVALLPGLRFIEEIDCLMPLTDKKPSLDNYAGSIAFERVSLSCQATGRSLLQNITLTIPAGAFIGIIGPSGAGKSTLLRLLLGLSSGYSGNILLDNVNVQYVNWQSVRRQFGVVLQTSTLLPGSIYTNIAANQAITLNEAWELARLVGLDVDIKNMPMQMHTQIADNAGDSLSGGQRQKILLARALARKPKVLLLDEATSALDNHSQTLVYQHLQQMCITRIVIAHRYSTIVGADNIYRLDNGVLTIVRESTV